MEKLWSLGTFQPPSPQAASKHAVVKHRDPLLGFPTVAIASYQAKQRRHTAFFQHRPSPQAKPSAAAGAQHPTSPCFHLLSSVLLSGLLSWVCALAGFPRWLYLAQPIVSNSELLQTLLVTGKEKLLLVTLEAPINSPQLEVHLWISYRHWECRNPAGNPPSLPELNKLNNCFSEMQPWLESIA